MSPTQAKLPEDFSVRSLPQTSTYTQWFPNSSSIPPELQERENDALEAQTWVWSFLESYSLSSCPSAFGSEVAQVVSTEMGGGEEALQRKEIGFPGWVRESWLKLEKAKGGLEVPSSRFPVCEAAGAWEGGVNFLSRPPDWKASLCLQYLINKVTFIMLEVLMPFTCPWFFWI